MARATAARIATDVAVEFGLMFLLWMLLASKMEKPEVYVAIAAALVATLADQVVKQEEVISFRPRLKQALLIFSEPYYALTGSAALLKAFWRKLAGKPSEAQFRAVAYDAGGDDPESQARRCLMVAYMTIPPNFIIIGIDREKNQILVHQVSPTPTPLIAKKLGARE
jgi:hypothetical protein